MTHSQSNPSADVNHSVETQKPLEGYELVADLMRRQDEALAKIDELNERVELAIESIQASRVNHDDADTVEFPAQFAHRHPETEAEIRTDREQRAA